MRNDRGLTVQGLKVGYGKGYVVHDVNLFVGPGEVVGLAGGNGQGKTTLLRAIVGFLKPASGTVLLDGERLDGRSADWTTRRGVAYVPQASKVFQSLTVEENLLVATDWQTRGPTELLQPAFAAFPELRALLRVPAGQLSRGQQQLVAIGRALCLRPRLLILDEPAASLAGELSERLTHLLHSLAASGTSLLIVEHDPKVLNVVADRGYLLRSGRIVHEGPWTDDWWRASMLQIGYEGEGGHVH